MTPNKNPRNAREVAAVVLFAIQEKDAWSDKSLAEISEQAGLEKRDSALASRIVYGVLQQQMLCDHYIASFSSIKLRKIAPRVLIVLRMGVYQLLYMDKIPVSASINESVLLIKRYTNARSAGFVNAILHQIDRNRNALPPVPKEDKVTYLSTKYSHPTWLVEKLLTQYGENQIEDLLTANNELAPVTLRVNALKADQNTVKLRLEEDGIVTQNHPAIENCLVAERIGLLWKSKSFLNGEVVVQDTASMLCALVLAPKPNSVVIDTCAAPGGKSFAIAALMQNKGRIISCDIYSHKIKTIKETADRLGANIVETALVDGSKGRSAWEGTADFVLCDAPCSGLGVIRKKPEIRYKDKDELSALPAIQEKILQASAKYVKKDGVLVYSTCTVLAEENERIVETFLQTNKNFSLETFEIPIYGKAEFGMAQLLPNLHQADGFFIAKLRRHI